MIEQISKCQKCGLCFNQKPLLDTERECQIFWVGLSAKKAMSEMELPLSPNTNTGKIIHTIEEELNDIVTYKTNLVKCLPLTEQDKLRYPNGKEIDCCFENLIREINSMNPQIIFLLGERVSSTIEKKMNIKFEKWDGFEYHYKNVKGIYYVPIHHPSYIYVYKRRNTRDYISGVEKILNQLLGYKE